MSLKTQKQAAKIVGIALGVGVVGFGVTELFKHHASAPVSVPAAPVTRYAPPAPPVTHYVPPAPSYVPAPPPAVAPVPQAAPATRIGDNASEKQQKLFALTSADKLLLQGRGYTIEKGYKAFGRDCNTDGTTDGTGWHGTSTGISYLVENAAGQEGRICVAHSGKGGVKATVSPFHLGLQ